MHYTYRGCVSGTLIPTAVPKAAQQYHDPVYLFPHLERLKLLEYVADDSRGSGLVGVGHGPPARLRAESLAQSTDAASGAKVHLAGDRGYSRRPAYYRHRPVVVWGGGDGERLLSEIVRKKTVYYCRTIPCCC